MDELERLPDEVDALAIRTTRGPGDAPDVDPTMDTGPSLALTRSASMPTPVPLPDHHRDEDGRKVDEVQQQQQPPPPLRVKHELDEGDALLLMPSASTLTSISASPSPKHPKLPLDTRIGAVATAADEDEQQQQQLDEKKPLGLQLDDARTAAPLPVAQPALTPPMAADPMGSIAEPRAASKTSIGPSSATPKASPGAAAGAHPISNGTSSSAGSSSKRASSRSGQSRPSYTYSLWDYLREEVSATDFDSTQEIKWERVSNFMAVPFAVEKIMLFGMAVCLDSFLYTFTILPLRFGVAIYRLIRNYSLRAINPAAPHRYLNSSHKCDIIKLALVLTSCIILARFTDASKMYHSVRGQDVVKLSVIFNVLEIADRLCCSLGQDLLDSLFSRTTLARRRMPDGSTRQPFIRPAAYFFLALAYILAHTLVLLYQLVTLNVAINAFDNALLTLLLSNQFVEIKGSVFKKFEKENLFQLSCADIVERFQLGLMLFAIGTRNLIELSGGAPSPMSFARSTSASVSAAVSNAAANPASMLSPLPSSFTILPSLSLLETVLSPVLIVIASECLVDWLKHAFITKFNHFRPAVYGRFMDVLCSDLVVVDAWAPSSSGTASASSSKPPQRSSRASSERVEKGEPIKREEAQAATQSGNDSTSHQHQHHHHTHRRTEPGSTSTVPFPNELSSEKAPTVRRARKHTFVDQSPFVARRLGFAALPLACLIVRITQQILGMLSGDESDFDECIVRPGLGLRSGLRGGGASGLKGSPGASRLPGHSSGSPLGWFAWVLSGVRAGRNAGMDAIDAQRMGAALVDGAAHMVGFTVVFVIPWAFLVVLKLLLGMNLAAYAAHRHATAPSREREEALNARNRPPIGMGIEELAYEARVSALLDEHRDDYAEGWNVRGEAVLPPVNVRRSGVLTGAPGIGGAFTDSHHGAEGGTGGGSSAKSGGGGTSASSGGGKKEGKGESLMDVSRYTMVRSRIW
ncbi:hypothetical protein OC844_004213 [Tilletia horrida]|nr:hypothetical protein OC844_004213 [Tilletia horrida]